MQDIFHDFSVWLVQFLAVSAGVLAAARMWTVHRRRRLGSQAASNDPPAKTSSPLESPALPWNRDPALIRLARVLLPLLAGFTCFAWGIISPPVSPWFWGGCGLAVLITLACCMLWLRAAQNQSLDLAEIRQLGNDFELAALFVAETGDLAAAFQLAAERGSQRPPTWLAGEKEILPSLGQVLSRISASLQNQFEELTGRADISVDDLRSFADAIHLALSRRAFQQAERVSRWGKYPVLLGTLPVVCLVLVAPLTEWVLDQMTAPVAVIQPVRKPASGPASQAMNETARSDPEKQNAVP